mgnify:CR=1 FL=1
MNQPDPQTQIDNYLMNRLSPEQRQQFERQMASDSELADAVALQKLSLDLLEAQNDTVLRDAVRRAQAQGGSGGNANNGGPRNYGPWLIGFLLLALLGTLGYYFSQSQSPVQTTPPDAEQLFAEYFKAYPLNFASREINGGDQALVRANQFYRTQQYAEAIPQFQKSLATADTPKVRPIPKNHRHQGLPLSGTRLLVPFPGLSPTRGFSIHPVEPPKHPFQFPVLPTSASPPRRATRPGEIRAGSSISRENYRLGLPAAPQRE